MRQLITLIMLRKARSRHGWRLVCCSYVITADWSIDDLLPACDRKLKVEGMICRVYAVFLLDVFIK